MLPCEPPEPTPSSLPFQVSVGSQTSNPIIEVVVGCATPTARQNTGRPVIGGAGGGGSNTPEVTRFAAVILASGSGRFTRSSQGVAADRLEANKRVASNAADIPGTLPKADFSWCMVSPRCG